MSQDCKDLTNELYNSYKFLIFSFVGFIPPVISHLIFIVPWT